jgi:hypothetical protein
MQNRYDHSYKYFYRTSDQRPRQNGIFAPGIDRFLLIDNYDFWMTLETAEILSSKLPTLVYLITPLDSGMTHENCLDYTIFDKTQQKIVASSIATGRQQPILKFMYENDTVAYAGCPEDFKDPERNSMLKNIQEYARYVHRRVLAINLTEAFYNSANNRHFADTHLPAEWTAQVSSRVDRSELDKGVFHELRKVLYLSNTPEEADAEIINIWKKYSANQEFLILGFYKIVDLPVPEELSFARHFVPNTLSTFLF